MKRRALLHLGLGAGLKGSLVLTLMGRSSLSLASALIAVRLWPSPDFTRLTFEAGQNLKTKLRKLDNPPRLYIDVADLVLDSALTNLQAKLRTDDPVVKSIRAQSLGADGVRIEVFLKQDVRAQSFALKPVAQYQYRQVFDFYPETVRDPLADLIANRASGQNTKTVVTASKPTTTKPTPKNDDLDSIMNRVTGKTQSSGGGGSTSKPVNSAKPSTSTTNASPPKPTSKPSGSSRLIIVAVDAGHGGEDPGAVGPSGLKEKDVVLSVAKLLAERINSTTVNGNPMRAFLTRTGDYFVPLSTRVRKARQVQADLFISVHADAFTTPTARGASVYALSTSGASSASAKWMAQKENSADLIGGVKTQGKDRLVQELLLDLSTTAQIRDSLKVGSHILNRIGSVGQVHKPRVEQASFAVLKAPDIPSILVETAFISNPEEEQRLSSASFQVELADSIMRGVELYFKSNPPLSKTRRRA